MYLRRDMRWPQSTHHIVLKCAGMECNVMCQQITLNHSNTLCIKWSFGLELL